MPSAIKKSTKSKRSDLIDQLDELNSAPTPLVASQKIEYSFEDLITKINDLDFGWFVTSTGKRLTALEYIEVVKNYLRTLE